MGEGLNKPVFSQRCLQTFFIFLSPAPRSFSHALFARELADVFEKNEKKNKTTSVYRLQTWQRCSLLVAGVSDLFLAVYSPYVSI